MEQLLNQMRFQAGIAQNAISQIRLGIVTSYNPVNFTVTVSIQPEDPENPAGSQSGWFPIATSYIGLCGAPRIDDQVVIAFQEGDLNTGIVIGRLYSQEDVPPEVPSGEWWLTHTSGSLIKVKNNGDIDIHAANNVNVTSPHINLSNGGSLLKLVTEAMTTFFNTHTHAGGAVPDQTMGNSQLTTIVKGQ